MTLKTRRIIFYGLFFVFFPLSVGVVFYSQGWRFNSENFSLQKTGAVYIETTPKNVIIKLNNKTILDQSGLIKSGTLISDLLPKNYGIEIQKDDYLAYRKNIRVESSMVSELVDIVLIPKKFEKTAVIEKIKGGEIADLNEKRIIVKNTQSKIYYFYKLNTPNIALNINASFNNLLKKPEIIERAALHPFNEDRLIIETGSGLYVFDARKLQIEKVFSNEKNNKILTWAVDNPNIYIVKSKDYAVSLYNLITKTEADVVKLPESSSMVREIKVFNSQIGVLEKSGALSLFNAKEKKFRLVADNAEKFHFSPDNKKIFFMGNDGKINIYFIGDWYKNIKKKPGDIISFDLKNKGLAKNAFWHKDSFHLFVEYGSGNPNLSLEFMEIDDRQPLNQYPIIAESESNYYEAAQNLLCFIQNKTLYSIKY